MHCSNNSADAGPIRRAIMRRRTIDITCAEDFHKWQQSYIHQGGKRPATSTRDLIGLGTILNIAIITINANTKDRTTIHAPPNPTATVYLNSFNGQHLDFQPHPANPDTITTHNAPERVADQAVEPPPAVPGRTLQIDDDGEETEKKEGDDDGKGPSGDTSTRNDGERREEKAEIHVAVEMYDDDEEMHKV